MLRVYIFGGFLLVIAMAATYFMFLGKLGQKLFEKKKGNDEQQDQG